MSVIERWWLVRETRETGTTSSQLCGSRGIVQIGVAMRLLSEFQAAGEMTRSERSPTTHRYILRSAAKYSDARETTTRREDDEGGGQETLWDGREERVQVQPGGFLTRSAHRLRNASPVPCL
jgi:hypothetical protein